MPSQPSERTRSSTRRVETPSTPAARRRGGPARRAAGARAGRPAVRDLQLDAAGARVPAPRPVAIAPGGAIRAALAVAVADFRHVGLHHRLGEHRDRLTQEVEVTPGCLLAEQLQQVHAFPDHRSPPSCSSDLHEDGAVVFYVHSSPTPRPGTLLSSGVLRRRSCGGLRFARRRFRRAPPARGAADRVGGLRFARRWNRRRPPARRAADRPAVRAPLESPVSSGTSRRRSAYALASSGTSRDALARDSSPRALGRAPTQGARELELRSGVGSGTAPARRAPRP